MTPYVSTKMLSMVDMVTSNWKYELVGCSPRSTSKEKYKGELYFVSLNTSVCYPVACLMTRRRKAHLFDDDDQKDWGPWSTSLNLLVHIYAPCSSNREKTSKVVTLLCAECWLCLTPSRLILWFGKSSSEPALNLIWRVVSWLTVDYSNLRYSARHPAEW